MGKYKKLEARLKRLEDAVYRPKITITAEQSIYNAVFNAVKTLGQYPSNDDTGAKQP